MNYDFTQLNDKEFEQLSADLLSTVFGRRIERFKPGKDGGVDGRFFIGNNREVIIQCKHYAKSGYATLKSKLKNEEAKKVQQLNPEKYIFVTSVGLTRKNKTEIKSIFSPFIKNDDDIFGQDDLNDILSRNPNIEEKHYKLWITSTNVFTRIISKAIKGRSEHELVQIKERINKYVATENHNKAIQKLNENNVLIISGEPGIGKTTLAENICLWYVAKGFSFFDIVGDQLSEAEQVFEQDKKQIFYFDDFLGSNYLEAIENNKDSHIMRFIERIKHDKSKKFILTSRTNIFNIGITYSDTFYNKKINKNEFLLIIDDLTPLEKGKILYNHIWFSNLPVDFIDEIYKNKRYHNIIRHKNFNPRLIEFITDIDRIDISADKYWEYIVANLDNPKNIWNHSFKKQSDDFIRNFVMLIVFNGRRISEDTLRSSFNELKAIENLKNLSHIDQDFNSTARIATRSFVNRHKTSWMVSYTLFNPSIADFILNEYSKDIPKLIAIYKSLGTVESVKTLLTLQKEDFISIENSSKILDELFLFGFKNNREADYLLFISHLIANKQENKEQIVKFLNEIITSSPHITEIEALFNLLTMFRENLDIEDIYFMLDIIQHKTLKKHEILAISKFLEPYRFIDQEILSEMKEQIESYLASELEQIIFDNIDIGLHVVFASDNGDETIEITAGTFSDELQSHLENIVEELSNYNNDLMEELDIDYIYIIDTADMDSLKQEYAASISEDTNISPIPKLKNEDRYISDIDDLFER